MEVAQEGACTESGHAAAVEKEGFRVSRLPSGPGATATCRTFPDEVNVLPIQKKKDREGEWEER